MARQIETIICRPTGCLKLKKRQMLSNLLVGGLANRVLMGKIEFPGTKINLTGNFNICAQFGRN